MQQLRPGLMYFFLCHSSVPPSETLPAPSDCWDICNIQYGATTWVQGFHTQPLVHQPDGNMEYLVIPLQSAPHHSQICICNTYSQYARPHTTAPITVNSATILSAGHCSSAEAVPTAPHLLHSDSHDTPGASYKPATA